VKRAFCASKGPSTLSNSLALLVLTMILLVSPSMNPAQLVLLERLVKQVLQLQVLFKL